MNIDSQTLKSWSLFLEGFNNSRFYNSHTCELWANVSSYFERESLDPQLNFRRSKKDIFSWSERIKWIANPRDYNQATCEKLLLISKYLNKQAIDPSLSDKSIDFLSK